MSDKRNLPQAPRDEEVREAVFKDVIREMKSVLNELCGSVVSKRFESVLLYNNECKNRIFPLDVVSIFNELAEDKDKQDLSKIHTAHFLNWCIETICCAHLIIDDVIDHGQTRYGKTCWHRTKDVGLSAINDALLFDKSVTYLMSKKLSKEFLDIVHEEMINLCAGQSLNDLLSKLPDLDCIDRALYEKMCTVQNSPLVTFPFKLGMQLAGKTNHSSEDLTKPILSKMALLFQMINDYQDLYSDTALVGKEGSDIQHRKCTWFEATFMEKAHPEQKVMFKLIYGSKDPADVAKVKSLYTSLNLREQFFKHKADICKKIEVDIGSLKQAGLQKVLCSVFEKIICAKIEEIRI